MSDWQMDALAVCRGLRSGAALQNPAYNLQFSFSPVHWVVMQPLQTLKK